MKSSDQLFALASQMLIVNPELGADACIDVAQDFLTAWDSRFPADTPAPAIEARKAFAAERNAEAIFALFCKLTGPIPASIIRQRLSLSGQSCMAALALLEGRGDSRSYMLDGRTGPRRVYQINEVKHPDLALARSE